jgi:hypothetical protein
MSDISSFNNASSDPPANIEHEFQGSTDSLHHQFEAELHNAQTFFSHLPGMQPLSSTGGPLGMANSLVPAFQVDHQSISTSVEEESVISRGDTNPGESLLLFSFPNNFDLTSL